MAIDTITRKAGKGAAGAAESFEVRNPADGSVITSLPVDGPERVAEVVARVRANQPEWEAFGNKERARWLGKLRDWILDHQDEIADTMQRETGKVRGEAAGKSVDCLGTLAETRTPPAWDELDAIRSISALLDAENALLAVARRPRAALGHGDELVSAALLQAGELLSVEETRISTVYDKDGRQRSAGLELWLPGEDFPRRGSGTVVAGSSLELEGLLVHAAVFQWRLEEREGIGAYEVMVRNGTPTAA